MIEKALIFNIQKFSIHDGPGIRTVIFFKGCTLRCFWCSNPESQLRVPEEMWDTNRKKMITVGEYMTYDEVIEEAMKDKAFYDESGGGVTLSGGEVLFQAEFATELAKRLRARDIHMTCETTGFAKQEVFAKFIEQMDLVYFDLKHHDSEKHREGTAVKLETIVDNLKYGIINHPNIIVRIPVIPNFNDSLEDADGFGKLLNEIGVDEVELLPFHQFGESKYKYLNRDYKMKDVKQLHAEDVVDFRDIIQSHGVKCFVNQ